MFIPIPSDVIDKIVNLVRDKVWELLKNSDDVQGMKSDLDDLFDSADAQQKQIDLLKRQVAAALILVVLMGIAIIWLIVKH
jgi:hypothetical protein